MTMSSNSSTSASGIPHSFGIPIAIACSAVVMAYLYNNFVSSRPEADDTNQQDEYGERRTTPSFLSNYLAVFTVGLAVGFGYIWISSNRKSVVNSSMMGGTSDGADALHLVMAEIDLMEPDF